jgi:hypothetical protein
LASSVKEHSAVADARVSIEVLEAVSADHATCVVRCLAGVVPVGHVFDTGESPDGEVVEVSPAVDSIWRYGEEVRFFDSARTARLEGLREMHRRGIKVLPGGDYGFAWTPHGTYARNPEHFVELLGFTPMEAIISATA